MKKNYQLTKYPVGSIREIWALSWPLMFGLVSNSLMLFVDRLFLSWHSSLSLNAGANGGMAYFTFLVLPLSICAMSEVLAGRLNGEGRLEKVGNAVWQMVWFTVFISPLFWIISFVTAPILFYGSTHQMLETIYFQTLMYFAPFLCFTIALSGFFISTGKVKIVTYSTIFGNIINSVTAYVLIFGVNSFPSLGIKGAALATAISQVIQTLFLLFFFLQKQHRVRYGTGNTRFNPRFFKDGIRIGAPTGLGHAIEVLTHFLVFRMIMMVSNEHLTIVVLVQTLYILISFVIEAQSKSISGIASNLIGAKQFPLIHRVFRSGLKLHSIFFIGMTAILVLFPETTLDLFISNKASAILEDTQFKNMFFQAMLFMCVFFLFDGFAWIVTSFLVAAGDTKYILYTSLVVQWLGYVLPIYLFVYVLKNGANVAWFIIALMSFINFMIYFLRYKSQKWLKKKNYSGRSCEEPRKYPTKECTMGNK